ncbi:MAG: aldose 1-epimerase [Maricaulaceae bacterium]
MAEIITLVKDGWQVKVVPENGASITECSFEGQPILRAVDAALGCVFTPEDAACFPLIPFSNRIENGGLAYQGDIIQLPSNHPTQKHPLHGYGWLSAWDVIAIDETSCVLHYNHAGGPWPWPFKARYELLVSGNDFLQKLSIKNTGEKPMPVGLGFHPYFANADTAKLQFNAEGMWQSDDDILPVSYLGRNDNSAFENLTAIHGHDYDHCFSGWNGKAYVEWDKGVYGVNISASSNCNHAVLYTPKGESFFCFEPVTHMNNAMSGRYGLPFGAVKNIGVDEIYTASMQLSTNKNPISQ